MGKQFACGVRTYPQRERALHTRGPALHAAGECQVVAMVSCPPLIPELRGSAEQFCELVQMHGGGAFPPETRLILGDFVIRCKLFKTQPIDF